MHIAVLLKRVPETTARVRPAAGGKSVEVQGGESILSTYDEIALERAIQLREAGTATRLTAVCLGPADATKELRKALAMGADDAVLLVDKEPFRDAASSAAALAACVKELGAQAVFCGWKAIDDDSGVVGGYVAALLGWSYASFAMKIDVEGGKLVVHREVEGATQVVEVPLPAVVTAQKGLAEPRVASLKGIMAAKKKPLVEKAPAVAANGSELAAYTPPPDRPPGRIVGEGAAAVPELVRILKDEVHAL